MERKQWEDWMEKKARRSLMLAASLLLLGGCGRPYYFDLQPEFPAGVSGAKLDKVLRVEDVGISETYRDFRIVCRVSPHAVRYLGSASWSNSPDELIGDAMVLYWSRRALFKLVLAPDAEGDADWVMRARVNAVEKRLKGKKWQARLAMDVEIADAESGKLILSHSFDRSAPLAGSRAADLPEALSRILMEEMQRLEGLLRQAPQA